MREKRRKKKTEDRTEDRNCRKKRKEEEEFGYPRRSTERPLYQGRRKGDKG